MTRPSDPHKQAALLRDRFLARRGLWLGERPGSQILVNDDVLAERYAQALAAVRETVRTLEAV